MFGKFLRLICVFLFVCVTGVSAQMLKGSVALDIPADFYGTWRVSSVLVETNSPPNFKKKNVDIWNLSKTNDVINLSNPFSGASATINVDYANASTVRFSKTGKYDNKDLTDTIEITINGDKFVGVNKITLQTRSQVDNSIIKTATATYNLKGSKIAGMSIRED